MVRQSYLNRLFSIYAPIYFLVGGRFNKSRKLQAEQIQCLAQENELRLKKILIVGGGDGVDIPFYLQTFQEIIVLDASIGMVKKMKAKYDSNPKIIFYHADASKELPFTEMFDAVLIHFCLSITSSPEAILQNVIPKMNQNAILSIIDVKQPVSKVLLFLCNWFTKYTMFNLRFDEQSLTKISELKITHGARLKELPLFGSSLYLKNE